MRRIIPGRAAVPLAIAVTIGSGCTDRLPTLTDADRIPTDLEPVTIEFILTADEFLTGSMTVRGTTTAEDSDDLVVAAAFDGVLDAHVLAEFEAVPDSIPFEDSSEFDFIHRGGEVRSFVPDTLSASVGEIVFSLWRVTEPWDSTATWTEAVSRPESQPWSEPGGTRGELLAAAVWSRAATGASADSIVWLLSPLTMETIAADSAPSFLVTADTPDARVDIAPLEFEFSYSPIANPDTTLRRTVDSVEQRFIYSEPDPTPVDELSAGGVTSDRTLLRLQLPEVVPGCPDGACPPVPTDEIVLNRVDLLLDPRPVPGGFRPVAPLTLRVRRLLEPELGELAPLGDLIEQRTLEPDGFAGVDGTTTTLVVTGAVGRAIFEDETDIGLALVVEPEASTFPYVWFGPQPRLRYIYTLRQAPELP